MDARKGLLPGGEGSPVFTQGTGGR
jgi:hypothetical protein